MPPSEALCKCRGVKLRNRKAYLCKLFVEFFMLISSKNIVAFISTTLLLPVNYYIPE